MRALRLGVVAVLAAVAWAFSAGQASASVCAPGATVRGVDVSIYQGTIDWPTVAASGIAFGYARAAYGTDPDPTFQQNYLGMQSAGIQRGAYLFFRPSEDPVAQADALIASLQAAGFGPGDLPPMFDVEVTEGLTPVDAAIATNLQTAIERVQSVLGVRPGIETSAGWWDGNVGSTAFGADPLWVANWGVSCPTLPMGWTTWQTWQYSDLGSVPGIPATVDLDEEVAPPVETRPTTTVFTAVSATSGDFHDPVTLQARVTDANGPVAGGLVTFSLKGQWQDCTAWTDADGVATCSDFIPYLLFPGFIPYQRELVVALFFGHFGPVTQAPSDAWEPFTITPEETTLTYTGVRGPILAGSTMTLSARLLEDGTAPISGYPVQLGLPNQPCLQTTTNKDGTTTTAPYTTDATGVVACTLTVDQPLGPTQIAASFDGGGSGLWAPNADSAAALIYAYPTQGVPVLHAAQASPRSWWLGAVTPHTPTCGGTWTAQPDSGPHQVGALPAYMGLIVPGLVTRINGVFSGTIAHIESRTPAPTRSSPPSAEPLDGCGLSRMPALCEAGGSRSYRRCERRAAGRAAVSPSRPFRRRTVYGAI